MFKKPTIFIVGIFISAFLCSRADAAIIHVPQDYPTIQEAINVAVEGDKVLVAPGEYDEDIHIKAGVSVVSAVPRGARIGNPLRLVIVGWGPTWIPDIPIVYMEARTRLEGFVLYGWDWLPNPDGVYFNFYRHTGIELSKLSVPNKDDIAIINNEICAYYYGIHFEGSHKNIIIKDNTVKKVGVSIYAPETGIEIENLVDSKILNNYIYGAAMSMQLAENSDNNLILSNKLESNEVFGGGSNPKGLWLSGNHNNLEHNIVAVDNYFGYGVINWIKGNCNRFKNNTFYLQQPYSNYAFTRMIWVDGVGNQFHNEIVHNVIENGPGGQPVYCFYSAYEDNDISYTMVSNLGEVKLGDLTGPDALGEGSFFADDPKFCDVRNSDFHLAPGSVCIDAGDPDDDYSKEPEPNGGRINQGSYGNTAEATGGGRTFTVAPQGDFRTIIEALEVVLPGDTILVAGGLYFGQVKMKPYINLIGSGADYTTINPGNTYSAVMGANGSLIKGFTIASQAEATIYLLYVDGMRIEENKILDTNKYGIYIYLCSNNNIISNNFISGPNTSIFINGGSDSGAGNQIKDNVLIAKSSTPYWSYADSIKLYGPNNLVSGNICILADVNASQPAGIEVSEPGNSIINNTIYLDPSVTASYRVSGIFLNNLYGGSAGTDIRNNIMEVSNVPDALGVFSAEDEVTINYNLIHHQSPYVGGVNEKITLGQGNIVNYDPLFLDPGNWDFHLTQNSPCIDAGDPDPQYNDPDGTRNDMGALFYNPGQLYEVPLASLEIRQ